MYNGKLWDARGAKLFRELFFSGLFFSYWGKGSLRNIVRRPCFPQFTVLFAICNTHFPFVAKFPFLFFLLLLLLLPPATADVDVAVDVDVDDVVVVVVVHALFLFFALRALVF